MRPLILVLLLAGLLPFANAFAAESAPADTLAHGLALEPVADGLESPLFLTAPAGDARLFVLEQSGRIRIVRGGKLLATPFLDLSAKVSFGGERGLLGLAFHPAYARNGRFYVNYTDRHGDTRIERYQVSRDPDRADPATAALVLTVKQPYANHNGGMLAFGPDGRLYVGMGDGGSGGDPQGNGQNPDALLGKLLRLDVDRGTPYAVPGENLFVRKGGGRGEIFALGLRNPWRFSFDRTTRRLYVADVGQNQWEEIDVLDADSSGANLGWNAREGLHAFARGGRISAGRLVDPALEYGHDAGCSVTGGYVYRGRALPRLAGTYFYSDYCGGWLRSFRYDNGRAIERRRWDLPRIGPVTSFGEDAAGELYVITQDGKVRRIVAAAGSQRP